jgi:F-type H+-transporting ATPase subunit epsilon
MKEGYLTVDITTPQRKWIFEEIKSCTAPGVEGGFQVLFKHAPMLNQLDVGEIKLETDRDLEIFATSGGFLEVLKNTVSLLLESCEKAENIDLDRARDAAERARRRLQEHAEKTDIPRAEAALARALNRIRVAGHAK